MMGQVQKPFEEILESLKGYKKIAIMGCGGCSTILKTGGIEQVNEMAEKLKSEGKEIVGAIGNPFGAYVCFTPVIKPIIEQNLDAFKEADAILMMSCGDGLQNARMILEDLGVNKPMLPAQNSLGYFGGGPEFYKEKCQGCGECVLGFTAGICPLTECPKGLMNGPCGGTRADGTCEVDPDKKCAWVQIYERLDKIGEMTRIYDILEPHNWDKAVRPRSVNPGSLDLVEKYTQMKELITSMGI